MKRPALLINMLFIALALLSAPVFSQKSRAAAPSSSHTILSLLDQFGGGAHGMDVAGDYVYAAIGPRFVVFKQDEKGHLHMVSETKPFDDMLHSVAISGPYAFVAEYGHVNLPWLHTFGKLHVLDIRQPQNVQVVNTLYDVLALDMATSGHYLFVVNNDGLHIYDISQAPKLQEIGGADEPGRTILVHDHFVFTAEWYGVLHIYDVSNPSKPYLLSTYNWGSEQVWNMVLDFPYLTVANGYYGLTTIDVSDPTHPVKVATTPTRSHALAVTQTQDHLFVASGNKLQIFAKLPDGRFQEVNASLFLPDTTRKMMVQGHRLFAAAGGPSWDGSNNVGGLFVYDVDNPEHPISEQRVSRVSHARAVKWHEKKLFVAGDEGLYILDAHVSQNLQQLTFFNTHGAESVDVQKQGDRTYAFLAQNWQGMEIVDVTDPTASVSLSRFTNDQTNVSKVIVDGAYAYLGISNSYDPLMIVDISSPSHPRQIAAFHVNERSQSVSLTKQADKIYLVDGDRNMYIIDIVDPSQPTLTGALTTLDGASLVEIAVEENTAFIATGDRGVRIIDVSHPEAPQSIGSIPLPAFANHIQINDHFLLTSHFMDGTTQGRIYLTDVSNPSQPHILNYVNTAGEPYQAIVHQDDIFVPDGPGGVRLYQILTLDHHLFQPFTLLSR